MEMVETHLILFKHLIFAQRFHSVDLPRVDFLNQSNFTKSTFPDDFNCTEIFETDTRSTKAEKAGRAMETWGDSADQRIDGNRKDETKSARDGHDGDATHLDSLLPRARSCLALRVSGVSASAVNCFSSVVRLRNSYQS